MKTINVGLIGFGTIGVGVVKNLQRNGALIAQRIGAHLHIKGIADIDIRSKRGVAVDRKILTTDANKLLNDPEIDIIIELIGGYEPAKSFIIKALTKGKHVVTANKALLALHGEVIFRAAREAKRSVCYEASVGGGIPIIKALREGFVGNRINSIFGIVNGTSNYILTKMTREKVSFAAALKEAQSRGYAEKNPSFDVEGIDSAHKLVILASLAAGQWIDFKSLLIEGITKITDRDIEYADELGCVVKLLAIMKEKNGLIEARVHPTLIAKDNLLATINGVYNAICVEGDVVGKTMFSGRGAGQDPTSSAVMGDLVDIALDITHHASNRVPSFAALNEKKKLKKMDDVESRAYLRVSASDRPGVLAKIAGILGAHQISIATVLQKEHDEKGGTVPVVMLTHKATEKHLREALQEIDRMREIKHKTVMIRMEG